MRAHLESLRGEAALSFTGDEAAVRVGKNNPLVRAFLKGVRAAGGTPGFLLKTGTSDMNVVGPAWRCPIPCRRSA